MTDVINNKIELLNRVGDLIDHIISYIKNETNMIDEKIYKVSEVDNDTLHLINNKRKEIMSQLKQNIKKILVYSKNNKQQCKWNNYVTKLWGGILTAKIAW